MYFNHQDQVMHIKQFNMAVNFTVFLCFYSLLLTRSLHRFVKPGLFLRVLSKKRVDCQLQSSTDLLSSKIGRDTLTGWHNDTGINVCCGIVPSSKESNIVQRSKITIGLDGVCWNYLFYFASTFWNLNHTNLSHLLRN